jgi:DNA-binding transcriptional MerR regulator
MAVSNGQVPAKIKVTQTAYDLAMRLFAAEANKKPVPVTKDMLEQKLSELTDKKKNIAQRQGQTPGRFGKPGTVKLLVPKDVLEPIPNRAPRGSGTTGRRQTRRAVAESAAPKAGLSIAALEEFVKAYRRQEVPIREERSRAVSSRIAELQKHLGSAKGDDFRNTMAMANAELKKLDEIDQEVAAEVLEELNPGSGSPLYVVWKAMRGIA